MLSRLPLLLALLASPAAAEDRAPLIAEADLFSDAPPVATERRRPRRPKPATGIGPSTQIVLGPTARLGGRGQLAWSATDILWNRVSYTPHKNLQLELEALLPVLYVGFFPRLKLGTSLGGNWHAALQVHGGVFWPYHDIEALQSLMSARFALYGGGPILSYVGERLTFNLSVPLYGVRFGQQEFAYRFQGTTPVKLTRTYFEDHFVAAPSVGASLRLGRGWALDLEAHLPLSPAFAESGKLWLIVYGCGVALRQVRLALHFVIPAYEGAASLLRYSPLGIPLISTHLTW